ncbi:hypothetical protein [Parasphingorhabdus sp.]|uniref:hypothetical protein n=1 Tax=Parasphingorhabdus sp. TaxID=2709688 RepID=UPI0030026D7A
MVVLAHVFFGSVVTALAVARKRNDPASTITTLQKAIGDLKITVDSLAPIEGDVITLLANLRHRMEQELPHLSSI